MKIHPWISILRCKMFHGAAQRKLDRPSNRIPFAPPERIEYGATDVTPRWLRR
ncbi:hypothetical protein [Komagataeibacter swingsii]|uniref:Uncharacterized protein n=1 Tax=Komagataeibacter swingsii TaxID=215220 RepID=A0A850P3X7_9PROT|nr:hypothetical protein [Komagataeibacter swingsii]NVN35521.1 hypothetical protein [Komagataeibacter swingsii]